MAKRLDRTMSLGVPDVAMERVMNYIDDPRDRDAISMVCRKWYRVDSITRKHVTIALCYTTTPARLRRRFPRLESLKIKGKPRAAMFNLIPENWGGYVSPWVREISEAFDCLKLIHFRRMIVGDDDLDLLATSRGGVLRSLKLDKCSGFSTDGLLAVARSCKSLRTLFMEESTILEKDGIWLHELAMNNSVLETLNFYGTELKDISISDLELLARNCPSLVSLKTSDCELMKLCRFFSFSSALEEFCGGCFDELVANADKCLTVKFPPRICRLGLSFMGNNEMPIIYPYAASLTKLDLQYTFLDTEDHCQLIQRCPNLEVLEVRNVIGDSGLEAVARNCKKLRRLRIERGEDEQGMEDEQGVVSHRGLSALAEGCLQLEYLAVYVSDISNAALECMGTHSKNLCDFRLVLLDKEERITELPLDNGVRALLMGCKKLRTFALYLRPGGLSDRGLSYIGQHSTNVRWMLLGYVGETDHGLLEFSRGCPRLQKLEMRGCCFSEQALARAVLRLASLRYIWVQGYKASATGSDLYEMVRPHWNIEFIPPIRGLEYDEYKEPTEMAVVEQPAQMLAYYSLAGRRTDYPATVVPLYPLR